MKKVKPYKVISFSLPVKIVDRIEKIHKDNGWTKSKIAEFAFEAFFEK